MKLYISKLLSTALPIVGVLCIFGFAFAGNISMGWILFVVLALISGIINTYSSDVRTAANQYRQTVRSTRSIVLCVERISV